MHASHVSIRIVAVRQPPFFLVHARFVLGCIARPLLHAAAVALERGQGGVEGRGWEGGEGGNIACNRVASVTELPETTPERSRWVYLSKVLHQYTGGMDVPGPERDVQDQRNKAKPLPARPFRFRVEIAQCDVSFCKTTRLNGHYYNTLGFGCKCRGTSDVFVQQYEGLAEVLMSSNSGARRVMRILPTSGTDMQ